MKILVLQLARLGDIYLSWPALRALKRKHPQASITLVTRSKFTAATQGLEAVSEVIELPTKDILTPLIQDAMDVNESHRRLLAFVDDLRSRGFDQVINLSFSPASSYLTHLLQPDDQKVRGYSRTQDGFLAIPDDMSAYFYAQVGPGRGNRFHLAEIFGTLCGVDLDAKDWAPPVIPSFFVPGVSGPFVAVHIGASETQKALSAQKWISIFSHFRNLKSLPLVLIGAEAEQPIAESILASAPTNTVVSLVGKTSLAQTMSVLRQASLLVGVDSAPMHMASLTQTRCLNLSLGRVNFWETGPRAAGSWIVRASSENDLASDRVARAMTMMLEKLRPEIGVIQTQNGTPSYNGLFPIEAEFHWKLVQAIYQGSEFPQPVSSLFWEAHAQLLEINRFMIEQMQLLEKGSTLEERAPFIDRGEEVIDSIAKLVPGWGPAIRWYQTEKVRIGPSSPERVLQRTNEVQNLFQQVLELYSDMKDKTPVQESEAR